ncbi:winged helix-turn-helix transcriptional regulator [Streptomyces sp. NPDC059639]|uniref:winged helix-turn-helix transcriptional regulator n=1 Tax=Streptomyces sp. NPDC059639 TaxID=3346891 RepID=UPI003697813A
MKAKPQTGTRPGPRSECPLNAAVEVFGDRWTLLVLRDMIFGDRRHFRQLQAGSEEGIASNILADRLARLVETGLLTRDDPGPGRRATYSLTEPAIQLVPTLAHLGAWGVRHRPTTPDRQAGAEWLLAAGPEFWDDFMAELRERHLGIAQPKSSKPLASERMAAAYTQLVTEGQGADQGAV